MKFILILFLFAISLFATDESYSLDYIYVNANTGQSSGGHSALRLGEIVYHFQYFPDKVFHIIREPWEEFRYVYGIQENRTIQIQSVSLPKEDYFFFFERMNEIYLYQKKELDNLEKLDNDVKIIESVLTGDQTVYLKASGYFSTDATNRRDYNSLKTKINSSLGKNFLLRQIGIIRNQIYNFEIPIPKATLLDLKIKQYPASVENFSTDYLEMLSLLIALEILENETDLNKSGYFLYVNNPAYHISKSTLNKFSSLANQMEDEIIRLLNPNTINNGYPLLVTIARYLVIRKSISEGKLFLLNSFGKNHSLVIGEATYNKSFLTGIYKQISSKVSNHFSKLENADSISERDYTILEDSANRQREIYFGLEEQKSIRVNYELMLPAKENNIYIYRSEVSTQFNQKVLEEYKLNRDKYAFALQEKYSFNLFTKNCTTEIFHSLNSFFNENDKESSKKLGGVIKGDDVFIFVPVYAYYAVQKKYKVSKEEIIPSLRAMILKKDSSKDLLISMKELSTLTSGYYKFNREDSFFIFFTDDVILPRPIFGLVNLFAGIGEFSLGICISPFDKGDRLVKGLQGIFFSGPELLFFNVRKGTFIYEGKTDWTTAE